MEFLIAVGIVAGVLLLLLLVLVLSTTDAPMLPPEPVRRNVRWTGRLRGP